MRDDQKKTAIRLCLANPVSKAQWLGALGASVTALLIGSMGAAFMIAAFVLAKVLGEVAYIVSPAVFIVGIVFLGFALALGVGTLYMTGSTSHFSGMDKDLLISQLSQAEAFFFDSSQNINEEDLKNLKVLGVLDADVLARIVSGQDRKRFLKWKTAHAPGALDNILNGKLRFR